MKLTLDVNKCVGAGVCVLQAPSVFDQGDEDGVVVLIDEHPANEHLEVVRAAAAACPAGVIHLVD